MNEIETTKPKQKPLLRQRLEDWFHRAKIYLIFAQRHHPNLFYLWCFLLPAAIMTFCHACLGVFPFGRMSVLTLDLNAQYVFFFEALRDWVWGEGSLLYTFSRSLGGEFLGIYAYYLASPLSYIFAVKLYSPNCISNPIDNRFGALYRLCHAAGSNMLLRCFLD